MRGSRHFHKRWPAMLTEFFRMPPGVMILVVVMLWPVIWGGALMIGALVRDVTGMNAPWSADTERPAA